MELFLNGHWVNHKFVPTRHYKEGRSYTATGCGARIPTNYMVFLPSSGKWRRVYCRIFSNSGTLFIGKKHDGSNVVTTN